MSSDGDSGGSERFDAVAVVDALEAQQVTDFVLGAVADAVGMLTSTSLEPLRRCGVADGVIDAVAAQLRAAPRVTIMEVLGDQSVLL